MTEKAQKVRIYSVTELTRNIRVILEDAFPQVWVEGEVSNFTQHTSGHMYFTLKDEQSQLSCVIFRSVNQKIKFKIQNGIQLISLGRISVYDKRGTYQLYIEKLEPKGLGALELAFQQLKEKLFKEGLFEKEHKLPIPFLPTRIGIVTSPTGAAIRDILNVSGRRFSNVEIIINPVKVQGKGAAEEIAAAIGEFNSLNKTSFKSNPIDAMIVGRGGGSLEDLWAFNEEIVARAIYDSEIPIISAVGHQIDYTISDLVADLRAATPSAAAELLIPRKEELKRRIEAVVEKLSNILSRKIELLKEKVRTLEKSYVLREPLNLFRQTQQRIDELEKALRLGLKVLLDAKRQELGIFSGKLDALSPLAVLSRGYSITMRLKDGKALKDPKEVKRGQKIRTRLSKGEFISKVVEEED
jgi:exodeoxyribonuclease VII large subunit